MSTSTIVAGVIVAIILGIVLIIRWIKNKKDDDEENDIITINPDTSARKPIKKALLVGINKYKPELGADLQGCVNDVETMHGVLVNKYEFMPKNIRSVVDERATKQGILDRLKWLLDGSKAGDELVFHYSGHGSQVVDRNGDELDDGLDEILCPHDLDWDDPLTDDYLAALFKQLPEGVYLTMLCDSCLSGDTLIPLLDGTEKTIKQLSTYKGYYWVYSCDKYGKIYPGKAHSARITGYKKLIEITLDNNESFECTEDHLIMLRNGSYKQAKDLTNNDSLMPLYRREWKESDSKYLKGYELTYQMMPSGKRRWVPTHLLVRDAFNLKDNNQEKRICHHKNFNKRNNTPENLEMMSWENHKKAHGEIGRNNFKKLWANKNHPYVKYRKSNKYKNKQSKCITECWKNEEYRKAHLIGAKNRDNSKNIDRLKKLNVTQEHKSKSHTPEANKKRSIKLKQMWKDPTIREKILKSRMISRLNKLKTDETSPINHKIISIKYTNKVEAVYDLTVDHYHNFSISSGIFVHNCHSGSISRNINPARRVRNILPPFDIRSRYLGQILPKNKIGKKQTEGSQNHVLLSGCKDNQTSADAYIDGKYQGAFTWSLATAIRENSDLTWTELHKKSIELLSGYTQEPQLSGNDSIVSRKVFGG